jgi:WD40 repeat protein
MDPSRTRAAVLEGLPPAPPKKDIPDRAAGHGRLAIISWPGAKLLGTLPGDVFTDFAWTKSGQVRALAPVLDSNRTLQIRLVTYSSVSGKTTWADLPTSLYSKDVDASSYRLSPDGAYLAASLADNSWALLDASTMTAAGHLKAVSDAPKTLLCEPVTFTRDGRYLLRPTKESLEIWDLARLPNS